jgi:hypothetical protein
MTPKKKVTLPPQCAVMHFKFSHKNLDALHFDAISKVVLDLPDRLIIEKIRHPETIDAIAFARSPQKFGKGFLNTGIRRVEKGVGYGDKFIGFEKGKALKHFFMFKFDDSYEILTVYAFQRFMPNNAKDFVKSFLKSQLKGLNL